MVANFLINHKEKLLPPALGVEVDGESGGELDHDDNDDNDAEDKGTLASPFSVSVSRLFLEFFAFYGACCTAADAFSPFHHIVSIRHAALFTGKRLRKQSSMYSSSGSSAGVPPAVPPAAGNTISFSVQAGQDSVVLKVEATDSHVVPMLEQLSIGPNPSLPPPPVPAVTDAKPVATGNSGAKSNPSAMVTAVLPTWRFCIEDPYEEHDLGRVIYSQTGQMHMMSEMRRVLELYQQFASNGETSVSNDNNGEDGFWTTVCEFNNEVPKAAMICVVCGQNGHFSRDCSMKQTCHICHQSGHFARDCVNLKCRKCQQLGHFARDCPGVAEKLCKICRLPGHKSSACPHNDSRNQAGKKLYDPRRSAPGRASAAPKPKKQSERANHDQERRQSSQKEAAIEGGGVKKASKKPAVPAAKKAHNGGSATDNDRQQTVQPAAATGGDAVSQQSSQPQAPQHKPKPKPKPNKKGRVVEVVAEEHVRSWREADKHTSAHEGEGRGHGGAGAGAGCGRGGDKAEGGRGGMRRARGRARGGGRGGGKGGGQDVNHKDQK
jgi:hypothetical protein